MKRTNESLQIVKQRFEKYIVDEMSADVGERPFIMSDMDSFGRTKIELWIDGFVPFSDGRTRWRQHNQLYFYLRKTLHDLNVKYDFVGENVASSISRQSQFSSLNTTRSSKVC